MLHMRLHARWMQWLVVSQKFQVKGVVLKMRLGAANSQQARP